MRFTHLHVHSGYSAHFGVSMPEALAERAAERGMGVLALTDRDGLYGAVKHVRACERAGITPILGADLAVVDEAGTSLGRVVILANGSRRGYAALCRVVSAAHEAGTTPVIRRPTLAELATGGNLHVLIGPLTDVGLAVTAKAQREARRLLNSWIRAMPRGSLTVEIVCHLAEPGQPGSITPASRMLTLAETLDLPAVLTNAVRYADAEEAATADVADAARLLRALDDIDELQPTGQAWLKPATEMERIAKQVIAISPHERTVADLLDATQTLAERCLLDPEKHLGMGRPVMPEASVIGITGDPMRALWEQARSVIPRHYPNARGEALRRVEDRLAHEMTTVETLGFAPYFLTISRVVDMIRDMGVRIQARGSGVSSILNYLLGISNVDPIANGLIWERFLSTERVTLPDIDVDVESARRHDVYHRVFEMFGEQRVTLMSMTNQYRSRGAVRDAGLALGLPHDEIDRIAKELWRFSARTFRRALAEKPELSEIAAQVNQREDLDLLVSLTERLDSLPRHTSVHPCGVILSDATLLDRTPVQRSGIGLPMSQFDKHDVDPMGLIKLDILGVRMQSTMAHALSEQKRITGERIDLDAIPLDDEATYETIRSTHTLGIFQVESPGQMELVGKLQPRTFNDLIIDISLFRPGPMQNDMPRLFLEARHGQRQPDYIDPRLEPILKETLGIVVFHEQVMLLIDELTGCGLGASDVLRRRMGDAAFMPEFERFVRERAADRGFTPEVIEKAWNILSGFASFGFAKAHGAAFALPTYQSAWLKTHYPAAHIAGLLTHDPGMWPKDLLVAEARHLGVPILPMDVQRSTEEYRLEVTDDGKIGVRMALTDLIGSSEKERARIVAHQPFSSLQDFRDRVRPRKTTFESLARVGALDAFIDNDPKRRHELLVHIRRIVATPPRVPEGQLAFDFDLPVPSYDGVIAFDLLGRTQVDIELEELRLGVTNHVMERFHPLFRELGVTPARSLIDLPSGSDVLIAGVRRATNTPPMRSGRRTVFVTLDDGTGLSNIVFFPDAQERIKNKVFRTTYMLVHGTTRRSYRRGISVTGHMAWDLLDLPPRPNRQEHRNDQQRRYAG